MNSVCIVGRLTRDPETKQTSTDLTVVSFSVAVNRQRKNKQGEYEADFINCTAFGKTAEFVAKYFSKGQFIGVTGRIQTRKWQADDGTTRYATDIIADNVCFTTSASSGGAASGGSPAPRPASGGVAVNDYDKPASPGYDPGAGFSDSDDDELPF